MTKKIGRIVLIVGFILVVVGIIINFIPSSTQDEKQNTQREDKVNAVEGEEIDTPQEVIDNTNKNTNEKIYELHTYNNQEYTIVSMTGSSEVAIKVNLLNTGSTLNKGWIKFSFSVDNKTIDEFLYHDELKSKDKIELYIQSFNTEILNATDYKISSLTDEELTEMNKTLSE